EITQNFLLHLTNILVGYIHASNNETCKVLEFHHPRLLLGRLKKVLFLESQPQNLSQTLKNCQQILKYCVKTGHPKFFNQISQGLDVVGLAGEWITAVTNVSIACQIEAPVYVYMEEVVLRKMCSLIGWKNGAGILTPGGTMSNLYSVSFCMQFIFPKLKFNGLSNEKPLVLFTSDQSHFSIKRAGMLLGIGRENVVLIKSDDRGKMMPGDLRLKILSCIEANKKAFLVSATSGTTVLGAFDPLHEIANLCEEFGLWFHVDAAWGGGLLLSKTHRHLLHGIHRLAHSVTWNPHKLMGIPLQCSAFLVREKNFLMGCNSVTRDLGILAGDEFLDDRTMQASRHNDILKLWLSWKAKGSRLLENQIDSLMILSRYMQGQISVRPGFELVLEEPEFLNICFWYVPQRLRHLPPGAERDDKLSTIAPKVKAVMMEKGKTMIGYQPLGDKPNFFRMIISNPASSEEDIDYLLDQIQLYGEL
ncbi:hypothetical protein HELRODRAFT_73271, partial [Helobdella robusta]|uniref:Glutamate decarboxylase n=1 Tax=Helobdella robusta TaxID=6412 RepID=T1G1C4_HELRO